MINKIRKQIFPIAVSLIAIFSAFALLDAFWLGWLASDWYQSEMKGMLRSQFITWPWLVFYLMYGLVTFILAVVPNREKPSYYASIDGALLGLASYGAYNLTNYSILEGFTLTIMLIDWAWGISLTAACATAGCLGFKASLKGKIP